MIFLLEFHRVWNILETAACLVTSLWKMSEYFTVPLATKYVSFMRAEHIRTCSCVSSTWAQRGQERSVWLFLKLSFISTILVLNWKSNFFSLVSRVLPWKYSWSWNLGYWIFFIFDLVAFSWVSHLNAWMRLKIDPSSACRREERTPSGICYDNNKA